MFATPIHEDYHIFNASTKLSAYGYIYYASLYESESYAISVFLALLALIGIGATVVLFMMHISAICYAHCYLYQPVHLSLSPLHTERPSCSRRVWCKLYNSCQCTGQFICDLFCRSHWKSKSLPKVSKMGEHVFATVNLTPANSVIVQLPKPLFKEFTSPCPPVIFPGVSIIKPLSGVDINLEVNLTSYFQLDYPKYELLFCVADDIDPACDIVRKLQSAYPHVISRLIVAEEEIGVNPKINNLQAGYVVSQYDLILISDAGVWMRPDTLTDMVATLLGDPRVGMVHQVPFLTPYLSDSTSYSATHREFQTSKPALASRMLPSHTSTRPSFAWIMQLVFFGCWHAKISLCASLLGINCTTGMSCLIRKSILSEVSGFKPFACYLAEDFFLAKHMLDHGWSVRVSHQPAWQNSPSVSLNQFWSRLNRWSQLRLSMVLAAYLLEPFSRCLPNALLGAFGFAYIFPDFVDPGVYFLCHMLIWFLLDYILLLYVYPPCVPLCITRLEYLIAWIFSELTAVPNHIGAAFKRELQWRDKKFRVRWGGLAEQVCPKQSVTCEMKKDNSCSDLNDSMSVI
ncbi:Ceramide glucosyltransferase [Fasciolopsis buskii]|uniref:ceramide glucosyltransferase n=1 Tax=Fasciolopsis buskii TaxID=27845 RepID=A0A8E0RXS9_9TREM|nr:Ceramide glucosyltransferase [Fasciolopsis buski]